MSSGTYALELRAVDLLATLERVTHSMQPWARQVNVALSAEFTPNLPRYVVADGNRLAQVTANFISNAIKFVPHDGSGTALVRAFPIARR